MVFLRCDMESDIFGWIDLVSYYQGRRIKAGFRDKKCQTKTQNFVFIKTLIVWKEKLKSFYGVSWECFALELSKIKPNKTFIRISRFPPTLKCCKLYCNWVFRCDSISRMWVWEWFSLWSLSQTMDTFLIKID